MTAQLRIFNTLERTYPDGYLMNQHGVENSRAISTLTRLFVVHADEKLTAFLELESTIRAAERPEDCGGREIKFDKLSRIK